MLTKYHGTFAAIHCEELTETAPKTANVHNLSHSAPENHLFVLFWLIYVDTGSDSAVNSKKPISPIMAYMAG